jgi:hypothetical protein
MITASLKTLALILATAGVVAYSQTPPNKPRATSDVKIRQRMGPGMETVLYIKGPRMRSEMGGKFRHDHDTAMRSQTHPHNL